MIKATVNDKSFEVISSSGGEIVIDGETFELDVEKIDKGKFHIIKDSNSYSAEVVEINELDKKVTVKINNRIYEVFLKNKLDLLLEKLGMDNLSAQVANDIKAPMPGLIFDIMVEVGTEVKKGDPVLILEAMKMENIIKAPADATVSKIHIEKGQSVEKNMVLISF